MARGEWLTSVPTCNVLACVSPQEFVVDLAWCDALFANRLVHREVFSADAGGESSQNVLDSIRSMSCIAGMSRHV